MSTKCARKQCLNRILFLRYAASNWHRHAASAGNAFRASSANKIITPWIAHENYAQQRLENPYCRNWAAHCTTLPREILYSETRLDDIVLYTLAYAGVESFLKSIVRSKPTTVNRVRRGGTSCLRQAIRGRQIPCALLLHESGADIHHEELAEGSAGLYENGRRRRNTPLMLAAREGLDEIVFWLVKAGAVSAGNPERVAEAFVLAVANGRPALAKLLISADCDLNVPAFGGSDWPLTATVRRSSADPRFIHVLDLVSKAVGKEDARLRIGSLPLQATARKKDWITFRRLLQLGTDPQPALILAAEAAPIADVELALKMGANINSGSPLNVTALQTALRAKRSDVTALLLDNGADPNIWSPFERSPLGIAILNGQRTDICALQSHGADINICSSPRMSAMELAITFDLAHSVVKLLVHLGAATETLNGAFRTSVRYGQKDMVRMLLDFGADLGALGPSGSALHAAAANGNLGLVKWLIVQGADVNPFSPITGLPVYEAVRNNHGGIVQYFIDLGAVLADKEDWTALHQAASCGRGPMIEMLLVSGMDVKLNTAHGTPLEQVHFCASEEDRLRAAQILIDAGARTGGKLGHRALDNAVRWGRVGLAQLLVENCPDGDVASQSLDGSSDNESEISFDDGFDDETRYTGLQVPVWLLSKAALVWKWLPWTVNMMHLPKEPTQTQRIESTQ